MFLLIQFVGFDCPRASNLEDKLVCRLLLALDVPSVHNSVHVVCSSFSGASEIHLCLSPTVSGEAIKGSHGFLLQVGEKELAAVPVGHRK